MIVLSSKSGYFKDKYGNRCYPIPYFPVGSIYLSVTNVNPSNYFGGTWEQIKDKFLLSAGDTYTNGTTGGEATHKLTTAELPSHNHIFTGEAHSHGLGNHTHTYDKANTPTGKASGNTGSTAITTNQLPKHTPSFNKNIRLAPFGFTVGSAYQEGVYTAGGDASTALKINEIGGGQGHTHTLGEHTHTIGTASINTGTATGNTANATQGGTIGNIGGDNAHNNMPPYLAVYVWKRTA